jgi:isoquinoline 1-oxidoreductase
VTVHLTNDTPLEPERYELSEGPAHFFELARRDFLKVVGGGILIACTAGDVLARQESGAGRPRDPSRDAPKDLEAWLHIAEDGSVTVYTGKVEIGQDIRTSLAQVVAEELHGQLASIQLVMGDTDLTPYDMGTFGSRTTAFMGPQLRRAAASAREALLDLAAAAMKVDRGSLVVADARVTHPPTKRSMSYGELTKGQKLVKLVSDDTPLTPAARWEIAGQPVPKVSGHAIVTGEHRYVSDVRRPGMLYGKVLRAPAFGATLASVDTREAQALQGVAVVRDGDFVGVAAPTRAMASRALEMIKPEWKTTPQISAAELFDYFKKNPVEGPGSGGGSDHTVGSVADGLARISHHRS